MQVEKRQKSHFILTEAKSTVVWYDQYIIHILLTDKQFIMISPLQKISRIAQIAQIDGIKEFLPIVPVRQLSI